MQELQQKLACASKAAAEKEIRDAEANLSQLKRELDEATANHANCEKKIGELNSSVKTLSQQLEGAAEYSLPALQAERQRVSTLLNEQAQRYSDITARCSQNRNALTQIQETVTKLTDLLKKRSLVALLSDTANGGLSGTSKVMLETYVQAS